MKKYFLTIVVAVVVVLGVLMAAFFLNNGLYKWKILKEIKQCESIFNSPIKKITLRKSVTSPEWAVFDDEDLILLWTEYFKNVKVKRENVFKRFENNKMNGGGESVIVITTEEDEISIILSDAKEVCKFEIDGYIFDVNSFVICPFDKTYNEAIERHGITGPWD